MQRSSFLDARARLTIIRQLLQTSRRLIYSTYLPVCSLWPSVSQRAASLLPCEAVAPFFSLRFMAISYGSSIYC